MPGERFPATRLWMMSSWEVENLTLAELGYAINEMYARRGTDFVDKEIKRSFSGFEWYHPVSGQTYQNTLSLFSTIELYNLRLLGSYLGARKGSTPPKSAPTDNESPSRDSTRQQTARKPKFLYAPRPTYPPGADKMHVTGSGRFKITFNERGNAKSVEIVQSTGNRVLDGNTIKTLKRWRVDPGSPFYVVVPIDYRQKQQSRSKPKAPPTSQSNQRYSSPSFYPSLYNPPDRGASAPEIPPSMLPPNSR
jgi:TonB family protein